MARTRSTPPAGVPPVGGPSWGIWRAAHIVQFLAEDEAARGPGGGAGEHDRRFRGPARHSAEGSPDVEDFAHARTGQWLHPAQIGANL
jgi:hypothetical protein